MERRQRRLFGASAGLLALLLIPSLWIPWGADAPACAGATCDPTGDPEAAALERWQAFWAQVAEQGVEALRPAPGEPSLRAAGDTAFMRYRNLWGEVSPSARLAFQAAALANAPERKLALLRPLTQDPDPRLRFRAWLEIARVQLRRRDLVAARETARSALDVPGLPERIRADAHFVQGYAALKAGDLETAETALNQAVAADPGFWDGRQTQLIVATRLLAQPRQGLARCLDRTRQLVENLGALPALAQDRTQFRDIADRFATQGGPTNPAFALLSGLGYLWAGDRARAQATLAGAAAHRGRLPAPCEELILARATEWRGRLAP